MAGRCGGGRERGLVRALLGDSERRRLQDAAGWERGLVAGWAAAVQGWGKAAPFACLQLQKKVKKSRASEAVNNNCLICLDMMQTAEKSLVLETKPAKEQSKPNSKFSTCTTEEAASEKEEVPVHSSEAICGPTTDGIKREICNGKFHSPQAFQGEKKSLPIKEFSIWHLETLKHKDRKSNEPSAPDTDYAESLLKPVLVLPPVKDATPKNNPDASLKKSKAVFSQTKMLYGTSEEVSSDCHESQTEQRGEKEIDVASAPVKEKMKMNESSFVPSLPKASFLQGDPEPLHWHCALLPDKKTATTSNSVTVKKNCNLASMQFLQTKGLQYAKQEAGRGPFTSNIRSRNPEAKQGSESKIQELSLLSGLLPSLTVKSWGKHAPITCHQVHSKSKKTMASKTVTYLSCIDLVPATDRDVVQTTKSTETSTICFKLPTCAVGDTVLGREKVPMYCIEPFSCVAMTNGSKGARHVNKSCSSRTFQDEKKNMLRKELNKRQPEKQINKSQEHKDTSLLRLSLCSPYESLTCITLKTLLVLLPQTTAASFLPLDPSIEKSSVVSIQGNDLSLSAASTETDSCVPGTKPKQTVEKETDDDVNTTIRKVKHHTALFDCWLPEASFLHVNPTHFHWLYAFSSDKNTAPVSSSLAWAENSQLASMQFPQVGNAEYQT